MRLNAITLSVLLSLSACGGDAQAPAPLPGWVIDLRDAHTAVLPAVEALAWRYDDYEGKPTTDIWIAAAPLSQTQREQLLPRRNGLSSDAARDPEALGLNGLLVRVDDRGDGSSQMLNFCRPAGEEQQCSGGSGLGMALVRRFDANSIAGEYYTRAPDGTLHAASFDAKLSNESSTPMPANAVYSNDGGEAGAAWLTYNKAGQEGDASTLKRHALPDHAADFDDPKVIDMVKRMSPSKPAVLAARVLDDDALLWVRDTVSRGSQSPGVQRISMQRVDGVWRVAGIRTN